MYKNKSALLFCLFVLSAATLKASTPIYRDVHATPAARTADLLSQMTLDEKLDLLSGDSTGFATKAVPRLGIPSIKMSDGPLGVRIGKATAFPSGILMGATFNPEIIGKVSSSIANEAKANGRNMLLGPCIDISRNPFGGRNFESFGEDPYLTSRMAESYVQGVQKEGVLASTKHFAMNDQEFKRTEINVIADERTMHEVHLPAFQAAVNAGTATVMASYNKLNGFWAAENPTLLTDILVKQWGFKGWVVSDWGATHSTANALNAGLAVEMPTPQFFTKNLLMQALNSRQVQASVVDDRVSRILFSMFNSGIFDADPSKYPDRSTIGDEEHRAVALKAAQEGIVLLKNDSAVLPLKKNIQHIAVIGPGAFYARTGGGGSSMVDPTRVVTSLEAMKTQFGEAVRYEKGIHMKGDFEAVPAEYWSLDPQGKTRGLNAEYWSNKTLSGTPALTRVEKTLNFDWQDKSPDPSIPVDGFSARWTSYLSVPVSGDYALAMMSDDGARVYVDDQLVFNSWHNQAADVQEKNMHLD
ncbi:MAG: glycoside hydrolase family 3 N-terminal domain-containing protein, partial [Pseudobdellovibrio sp.]